MVSRFFLTQSITWVMLSFTTLPMVLGDPASVVHMHYVSDSTKKFSCYIERCTADFTSPSSNIQDMLVNITFSKDVDMLLVHKYSQTGRTKPKKTWHISGHRRHSYTVGNVIWTSNKTKVLLEFCVKISSVDVPSFVCRFYLKTSGSHRIISSVTSSIEGIVWSTVSYLVSMTKPFNNDMTTSSKTSSHMDHTNPFTYQNTEFNSNFSQDNDNFMKTSIAPTVSSTIIADSRNAMRGKITSTLYSSTVQADLNTIETSMSLSVSLESVLVISSSEIYQFRRPDITGFFKDLEPSEGISPGTASGIMYSSTIPCESEPDSTHGPYTCRKICTSSSAGLPVADLDSVVKHLKEELKINKAKLSSNIRKRISAVDNRPISVRMGTVGALVIGTLVVFVMFSDFVKLVRYLHQQCIRH